MVTQILTSWIILMKPRGSIRTLKLSSILANTKKRNERSGLKEIQNEKHLIKTLY